MKLVAQRWVSRAFAEFNGVVQDLTQQGIVWGCGDTYIGSLWGHGGKLFKSLVPP